MYVSVCVCVHTFVYTCVSANLFTAGATFIPQTFHTALQTK